MYVIIAE